MYTSQDPGPVTVINVAKALCECDKAEDLDTGRGSGPLVSTEPWGGVRELGERPGVLRFHH